MDASLNPSDIDNFTGLIDCFCILFTMKDLRFSMTSFVDNCISEFFFY